MHINRRRGETRAFAWQHRDSDHYRDRWWCDSAVRRREFRQSVTVASFYEETRHKKKQGRKDWRLVYWNGEVSWHKYRTEKDARNAFEMHLKDRWYSNPKGVERRVKRRVGG